MSVPRLGVWVQRGLSVSTGGCGLTCPHHMMCVPGTGGVVYMCLIVFRSVCGCVCVCVCVFGCVFSSISLWCGTHMRVRVGACVCMCVLCFTLPPFDTSP